MTDFFEIIIAARKSDSSWIDLLIPIVFFIIYGLSKLIKSIAEKEEPLQDKERSSGDQPGPKRYKPINDELQTPAHYKPVKQDTVAPCAKTS